MKKVRLVQYFVIAFLLLAVVPPLQIHAKIQSFPTINMEVDIPDDTILLTKDIPDTDERWGKAWIADPKAEKKNFDEMGVLAILYDPNTMTSVRVLQKQTSKSKEIFHLSLLSEEELSEFLDTLTDTSDKNATITIDKYPQQEIQFFRLSIQTNLNGIPMSEINYGTIANGYTISFDIFKENNTEPIDETYIKELVEGTHFTSFLDKAEVEKEARESVKRLILIFVLSISTLILVIVIAVLLSKSKAKKRLAYNKVKADKLTQFYKEQKEKEEQNWTDTLYYVNRTVYTKEVIKDFCYYTNIFKKLTLWIVMALLYLLFLMLLFQFSSMLVCAVFLVLLFIFVYLRGIQIEKTIESIYKSFANSKSMEAVFMFYEDYYTLSGIQSITKYPYVQITEIKEYKDFIYLYLGSDRAVYLKKEGFEQGADKFLEFIKQRTALK